MIGRDVENPWAANYQEDDQEEGGETTATTTKKEESKEENVSDFVKKVHDESRQKLEQEGVY